MSSALANKFSFLSGFLFFGSLAIISITLADSGRILELLPFSALIRTFRCSVSIESHFSSAISPHRAPVSFSIWQKHAVFCPRAAINRSICASLGMYGISCSSEYFGGLHLIWLKSNQTSSMAATVFLVLSLRVDLARAAFALSGSNRSAPSLSRRAKDLR